MKAISSFQNSLGLVSETFRYVQKSKEPQADIHRLKQEWAQRTLTRMKVHLDVVNLPSEDKSVLFVGNHISYLDIPLLLYTVPRISFVAKSEVSAWPIFGEAARKIETVFVKRENGDSRKSARLAVHQALEDGKRVVIFPSGTTCTRESKSWKKGAFEIAHQQKVMIQPFRISYRPLRAVAYIDQDFFPTHLFHLFGHEKIQAKIEFHAPVHIEDPQWDALKWHLWTRDFPTLQDIPDIWDRTINPA